MNGRGGIANCLVLHDWVGELDQAAWFDLALQFFFEVGQEPNLSHVTNEQRKTSKLKPANTEKRLIAGVRYSAISISSTRPPHNDVEQWTVSAGLYLPSNGRRSMAFIYDARGLDLEFGLLSDLVHRIAGLVRPTYGYGFQRPFAKGPGWYALDMHYGLDERDPEDKAESVRIALWSTERGVWGQKPIRNRHLQGMQRDVFPFNLLTTTHLSRAIKGIPLRDWILTDGVNGRLNQINDDLWTWIVPEAELADVRSSLQTAGLLVTRPPT